jgi:hypothetical protein
MGTKKQNKAAGEEQSKIKRLKVKKQPVRDVSAEDSKKITGGAVDAFIWFESPGGAKTVQGETY